MMEKEKKVITRGKHPGRVTQGHKLAALMKKNKRRNIAQQRTIHSAMYRTIHSTMYSTAYRTMYSTMYSTVK